MHKAALAVAPSAKQTDPDPPSASEAAALLSAAWSADVERGVLYVERSNAQPKTGVKEETKTRQHRRVALDAQTMQLLAEHQAMQAQRCAALGCTVQDATFLFSPAPDGSTPWPPRSLTRRFCLLAKKLGLRSTRLHSLRHHSATNDSPARWSPGQSPRGP